MTTKQLIPKNGKLLNIPKGTAYKQKATDTVLCSKFALKKKKHILNQRTQKKKTISDHKNQVSKTDKIKKSLY